MIMRPMVLLNPALWFSRIVTFVFAALAAGSAVYWGLQWSSFSSSPSVAAVDGPQQWTAQTPAVEKALGGLGQTPGPNAGGPAQPLLASRFVLIGVVAGTSQAGAALIGVDGKPPRPFEVGARLGEEWVLTSVQGRRAVLSRSGADVNPADGLPAELVLDMPPVNKDKKGP
jgi:general secretion pathway protein C